MRSVAFLVLSAIVVSTPTYGGSRLKMDDKASLWPRAGTDDKIDFTNRMGKSMIKLSPELDNNYFMQCLEETANIGDTKDLTLSDMVRTCISLKMGDQSEFN